MRPRILVTRPEPGASRTAARLAQAGYESAVLPLTKIAPLDFTLPKGPFDAVIVTSAQALRSVKVDPLLPFALFAVGQTTAEAAKKAGFTDIRTAGGSVSSIAELVQTSAMPPARLLYLCGKVRRPELEAVLTGAGFRVSAVETYDAAPIAYKRDELAKRLGTRPFDAVTLMSAQAGGLFTVIAKTPQFAPLFNNSALVCFSQRVCDTLPEGFNSNVIVTSEATEEALMKCLAYLSPAAQ